MTDTLTKDHLIVADVQEAISASVPVNVPRAPVQDVAELTGLALVVERLAANPGVDVAKLERVIALQERILAHQARASFESAYVDLQAELPVIAASTKGDKWRYAPLEDIVERVRPILYKHGFSLAYRTEWIEGADLVRVCGILTHRGGHSRESAFVAAADKSGSKNAIQALGSTREYGRRYTTLDLLAIVTREADDDGQASGRPSPPDGFPGWQSDMDACADEGDSKKLGDAWAQSKMAFRDYAAAHARPWMDALKARCKSRRAGGPANGR